MDAWWVGIDASDLLRAFFRVGALGSSDMLRHDDRWANLSPGRCAFVWHSRPDGFRTNPSLLIAERTVLKKLLPQLMAVPGSLSPVTAFCRIWDVDSAKHAAERMRRQANNNVLGGLVGLMMAELYVRYGRELDLRRTGMGLISRLFSCSTARLTLLGGGQEESRQLLDAWLEAVNMTSNEVDVGFLTTVTNLSALLQRFHHMPSFDGTPAALATIIDLATGERKDLFDSVPTTGPLTMLTHKLKGATRESRLADIEKAISGLRTSGLNNPENRLDVDLICGYLLSLVDPGSTDFFDVALAIDQGRGYVAAAYTMCAGLMGGDKFLWRYDGFGLTVVSSDRWKTDSFLGASPDLSLEELRVLKNRISSMGFDFRTKSPAMVEVELVPDVTGCFQNGAKRESAAAQFGPAVSFRLDQIEKLTNELKGVVEDFRGDLQLPRPIVRKKRSPRN